MEQGKHVNKRWIEVVCQEVNIEVGVDVLICAEVIPLNLHSSLDLPVLGGVSFSPFQQSW